jgi:hypothetical protein
MWGPAGYRPGIAGLDTSAMYIAGSKSSPSTIAVIIRGTNFFSSQDWVSNLQSLELWTSENGHQSL